MRVDATILANLVQSSQSLSSRETTITQQLSSGLRLTALSDDPITAGRSSTLASTLSQQDTFLASAATLTSRTQVADTALASVVTELTSAVSLAVQGANDTESVENRQAVAQQISGIRDSILNLANSSYSGSYLFAGSKSTAAPFTLAADGTATYNGDSIGSSIRTTAGSTIATSIAGDSVFTSSASSVFAALQTAITELQAGTATSTSTVSAIRDSLDSVVTQRSSLDSGLSRLSAEVTYVTTQQTDSKAEQTTLLAADTTALATELSAVKSQQTALYSTLGQINSKSLFDYL